MIPASEDDLRESERRLIQKELFHLEDLKEAAERRFQIMFENALVGLFRGDVRRGLLTDANLEAARTFGFNSVETFILHVNNNRDSYSFFDSMPDPEKLGRDAPYSFSSRAHRRDGRRFWAQFSVRYTPDGLFIEGAVKDITDQVESMDRLRRAKAEADDANKSKSRFLATMSHEIRTPLNGIVGFAEILQENSEGPSRDYAGKILEESDRLMTLISQLLDFSRLEARKIELEHIPFNLREVVDKAGEPLVGTMKDKGLSYALSISEDVPGILIGDPMRLGQILSNLLSNAVKFTERGEVGLTVSQESSNEKSSTITIAVTDTGIGIPEDKKSLIFAGFEQADSSISRRYGGTGLGISISRELVMLMDGNLQVESRVGEGSRFFFTISMVRPEKTPEKVPVKGNGVKVYPEILKNLHVLVVEDHETNRDIARYHLERAGCRVSHAADGREALDFIRNGSLPDLIFMDVHMPEMDGLEATRQIRSRGIRVPIIGMTAGAYAEDRDRCLDAGMNDYLTKPLRRDLFLNRAAEHALMSATSRPDPSVGTSVTSGAQLRYNDFLHEMDGEAFLAAELLDGFVADSRMRLEAARGALEHLDLVKLHREAHSIKGGALNLMADQLAERALDLEKAAQKALIEDLPDGEGLVKLLENLDEAHQRFVRVWESIREKNETDERQPGSL